MELGRVSSPGNRPPGTSPPSSFSSPEKPTERAEDLGVRQDDTRLDISDKPLGAEEEEEKEDKPNGGGERTPLLQGDDVESQTIGGEGRGPGPEESLAEIEINSLLWIKSPGNEALKEAYETWQAKDVLFATRVDKKRKQSSSLMNEIYQLVGFYSVFQGVLLTAVAQSSLLHCDNWWTAFFLSLLASLVTVGGVIQKFLSVLSLEKTISNEEISRKDCIRRVQSLLQKREKFQLRTVRDNTKPEPKQTRLEVSAVLVVLVLLLFSALFLASILQILCDIEASAPAPGPQ